MSSFLEASAPLVDRAWAWFVLAATIVLLVAAWRVLGALAARHRDADPRAGAKLLAALAASLLLGLGGFVALAGFEASAQEGIHRTFRGNLNITVGESEYQENLRTVQGKPATIVTQEARLAGANANLTANPGSADAQKARDELWAALNTSRDDLAKALVKVKLLTPNHFLWQRIAPALAAHRDEEARRDLEAALDPATVASVVPADLACTRDPRTGDCSSSQPAAVAHTYKDTHTLQDVPMEQGVEEAFRHKETFEAQMASQLRWWVYPNLTGLFLAPFVLAGGSILRRAHVPSDTVGYKPYPGKAMGFFLLLGGFAVLAVPFAAWAVRDLARRSREGQIAL